MGDLPTIAERAATAGVTDTRPRAALADTVKSAVAAGRTVRYLPPYRADNAILLTGLLGCPGPRLPKRRRSSSSGRSSTSATSRPTRRWPRSSGR